MCGRRPTTATSTIRTAAARPSDTAQTSGETSMRGSVLLAGGGLLVRGEGGSGGPVAPGLGQARDGRDGERTQDHEQRQPGRDLRRPLDVLAPVDERQLVDVHRVEDQLQADERQDEREAL